LKILLPQLLLQPHNSPSIRLKFHKKPLRGNLLLKKRRSKKRKKKNSLKSKPKLKWKQ